MAFEIVEFRDPAPVPGEPISDTIETVLGTYDTEAEAIQHGRRVWKEARASGTRDVSWWIVRAPNESLARWIADRSSDREQILDLTTNTLRPVPSRLSE
ncbi:MAG: hypothetical protein R2823_07250 [Acidimicrobiia bacterium]